MPVKEKCLAVNSHRRTFSYEPFMTVIQKFLAVLSSLGILWPRGTTRNLHGTMLLVIPRQVLAEIKGKGAGHHQGKVHGDGAAKLWIVQPGGLGTLVQESPLDKTANCGVDTLQPGYGRGNDKVRDGQQPLQRKGLWRRPQILSPTVREPPPTICKGTPLTLSAPLESRLSLPLRDTRPRLPIEPNRRRSNLAGLLAAIKAARRTKASQGEKCRICRAYSDRRDSPLTRPLICFSAL